MMSKFAWHADPRTWEMHLLFLVENKQKRISLPPRRSKLWSAVLMRGRDNTVGAFFISLLRALAPLVLALGSVAGGPAILAAPSSVTDSESAPILIGAGDINDCGHPEGARSTAEILESYPAATIFAAGDLAYFSGSDAAFRCYDETWGRPSLRERTRPAVGNHEYVTYGAAGFFKYWRKARQNRPWQTTGGDLEKAYYSYNLGAWHVVVINSECADSPFFRDGAPSCDQGSEQERWLREDLKRFPTACTL